MARTTGQAAESSTSARSARRPGARRPRSDRPAAVAALSARGGSVAEFPTTAQAARAARELGIPVVMGAPNVLRGESHSGNVSAAELVGLGLVTALASDYLPSGLLAGAFALAGNGLVTLPTGIGLVTSGAAAVAGLSDRGSLATGLRADLALVDDSASWPVVRATFRAALRACRRSGFA